MSLNRLAPFILRGCLVGAAAVGAMVVMPGSEARAACIPDNFTCTTFDPSTVSTPSIGPNFFSGIGNSAGGPYTEVRVLIAVSGFTGSSFEISNFSLGGDGIAGSLTAFSASVVTGNGSFNTNFLPLSSNVGSVNFANSSLSFILPSGVGLGTVITADIQYRDNPDFSNAATSGIDFVTTSELSPVPGPLPILGAAAAFSFSRKLRRRIRQSV